MNFSTDAIELIKEFEGLELKAYPDPGNPATGEPWTIGYGRTSGVRPGDTCTREEAECWLIDDMEWADDAVTDLVKVDLEQCCHDCLVSFVYNIGAGAFGDSTLVRRLNNGEPVVSVIEQELPRWVNGASGPLPGLVRRREAEIALAQRGRAEMPPTARPAPISLANAAHYFEDLPHQASAFEYLEELLTMEELDQFAALYRSADKTERILQVPYFFQLDSAGPEAFRMCFSSTNAMALEYLQPGTLSGANGDDEYLARVHRFGDSTDAAAQVAALKSFGVDCEFITDGSFDLIEEQLRKGLPVPCGWLHKGSLVSGSPTGSGHWSLVVGMDGGKTVQHDPFGEASILGGYYESQTTTAGRFVRYSRKNWGPRWEVEGPGTGWMIRIK